MRITVEMSEDGCKNDDHGHGIFESGILSFFWILRAWCPEVPESSSEDGVNNPMRIRR